MRNHVLPAFRRLGLVVLGGLFVVGCGASTTGRLPPGLSHTAAVSVPRSNVELRSVDNFGFTGVSIAIPRGRVPGPALARSSQHCPGTPSGYRHVWVDGEELWAVAVGATEQLCEAVVASDGDLHHVRKNLPTDPVPSEVRQVVGAFGEARVIEVQRRKGPGADDFMVELETLAGHRYVLFIEPSGLVLHRLRRYPALVDLPEAG